MYLKQDANGEYGFYSPEIHGEGIRDDPAYHAIGEDLYQYLLEHQGQYRIDPEKPLTLEHLIPQPVVEIPPDPTPTDRERLEALEMALLELL